VRLTLLLLISIASYISSILI